MSRVQVLRVVRWVLLLAAAGALYYVTQRYSFPQVPEADDSMLPTLASGRRYLAENLSWSDEGPERGDIVVYFVNVGTEESPEAARHFARVLAVPGDVLSERDGWIAVNGEVQERFAWTAALKEGPVTKGRYVLMNDNEMSVISDSRRFGSVDERALIAEVFPNAELF
ncbi:MAG: signal peptidase I [Planctomycetota bacterium]